MHFAIYYARRFPAGEEKGSRRWGMIDEGSTPPTPEELEHEFGCMHSGEWPYEDQPDKDICERLFHDTNTDKSRCWFGQDKAAKVGHTSMSIGDVVAIEDRFYQCMPCGFDRINAPQGVGAN